MGDPPQQPAHPGVTPATVAARSAPARRRIHLPDSALVVRGGKLVLGDLEKAAELAVVKLKRPGLSVFSADVQDPQVLVDLAAGRLAAYTFLSFTTAERLRDKGFEMVQTFDPPHHTVWLPETEDREYWLREFRMSFDPPVERGALADYVVGVH